MYEFISHDTLQFSFSYVHILVILYCIFLNFSLMDIGKDDYIYRAANQISKAQYSEANANYEVAFAYYKSGVGILLHGVQGTFGN